MSNSNTNSGHVQDHARAFNWAATLSLLTAVAAVGTVALHLIGDVQHRQYLRHWGVDAGLFPKSADWILVNGYYSLVHRFIAILQTILSNLHWLVGTALVLAVYVFVLRMPLSGGKDMPAWLKARSLWVQRLAAYLLLSFAATAFLPAAMFLFTAVMVVPAALGEKAGAFAARADDEDYRKGCEKAARPCVELRRDGQPIARGFVLDSSGARLALLDEQTWQARVIALDGLELVTLLPALKRL